MSILILEFLYYLTIRQVELKSQNVEHEANGKSIITASSDDDRKASFGGESEGVVFYKPGGVVYR
jgi:hypothetical protein